MDGDIGYLVQRHRREGGRGGHILTHHAYLRIYRTEVHSHGVEYLIGARKEIPEIFELCEKIIKKKMPPSDNVGRRSF